MKPHLVSIVRNCTNIRVYFVAISNVIIIIAKPYKLYSHKHVGEATNVSPLGPIIEIRSNPNLAGNEISS